MRKLDQVIVDLYQLAPRLTSERVKLVDASDRICAESIEAPFDWPMQDSSAMDGYAFTHADSRAVNLPISQTIYAGEATVPLVSGSCARVFTGSLLPPGADTVVKQEDVNLVDNNICFIDKVPICGSHVRHQGSIFCKNDQLIQQGQVLLPQRLALVASTGAPHVAVTKRPRVALVSTGNELLQVDEKVTTEQGEQPPLCNQQIPQPWHCFDSNQPQLTTVLTALGCEVLHRVYVPDVQEQLERVLSNLANHCDLLITCGGVSVGEKDFLCQTVAKLGEVHNWKVAIRPGKPFMFGSIYTASAAKPVLCLPGNSLSALITSLMLVRPFIGSMLGVPFSQVTQHPFSLPCDFTFVGDATRTMWLQVVQNGGTLRLAGKQLSDQLVCAAQATGVVMLEAGSSINKGDMAAYLPYASLLGWK